MKYLILEKNKYRGYQFVSFGNSGKSAWNSLYWVNYHIGRRNLTDYKIMTVYSSGHTVIEPAIDVLKNQPEFIKHTRHLISKNIGIDVDPKGLVDLVNKGILTGDLKDKADTFIKEFNL